MSRWEIVSAPPLVGVHPNPGPRRSTHLDEETRWEIVFMWKKQNLSAYKIAKKLKISHNSAKEIIQKYQETKTVHDRPHPGRKRKLSTAETKKVVRMAKKRFCPRDRAFLQETSLRSNNTAHLEKRGIFLRKSHQG